MLNGRSVSLMVAACLGVSMASLVQACGASSNVLGATVPGEQRDTFEALLVSANAAYDHGDLPKALELAARAYQLGPESEEAALLYGFINLSLAGGDPYSIARALVSDAKKKKEEQVTSSATSTATSTATATVSATATSTSTSTSTAEAPDDDAGANDTLGPLKTLLGLQSDEIARIADLDTAETDLPIYIPHCAEEARKSLSRLRYIDTAIIVACRFVDAEARAEGDYRQECASYTGPRLQAAKAHFLWAFAHLTEALAFQSVLTYGSDGSKGAKSNLELRVERVKSQGAAGTAGLQTFLSAMQTISKTLAVVMPTSGRCSERYPTTQMRATLNDLLAVEAGLSRLPGLSDDIGKALKKALGKFKNVGSGDSAAGEVKAAQTKALRGDLTKNVSKSLSQKIDGLAGENGGVLPEEQKASICAVYGQISADAKTTPVACGGGGGQSSEIGEIPATITDTSTATSVLTSVALGSEFDAVVEHKD